MAEQLLPLAIGVTIAFLVRVYGSVRDSYADTLTAEARRVFLPAVLVFAGLLASGRDAQQAAVESLLSAAVALGLGGSRPAGPPKKPIVTLMVAVALSGCTPSLLGKLVTAGQYAMSVVDTADAAAERWFLSHPSLETQTRVSDALGVARAAVLAYHATLDAGGEPDPQPVIDAYRDLYIALREAGALGVPRVFPLGGAQGAPSPAPAALPSPAEFEASL